MTPSQRHQRLRLEVIEAYGGMCECCQEARHEFLCIDHRYGGGNRERKTLKGYALLLWLKASNFPRDKYRLLCANCNHSLGCYRYCPHGMLAETDSMIQELSLDEDTWSWKTTNRRP